MPPTGTKDAEFNIDQVMEELAGGVKKLPEQALRTAQAHRDAMIPRLIACIEQATANVAAGTGVQGNAHFFALFLLTEFRAGQAWPAIRAALTLPEDGPFDLFGDAITESLHRILAHFTAESPKELDRLIGEPTVNEYVRWEAARTFLCLVRDGSLTRDEAVERLRDHLRTGIETDDEVLVSGVVAELVLMSPQESLEDIKAGFSHALIDPTVVSWKEVERGLAEGPARFEKSLRTCDPTGIDDTVEELNWWFSFQETPSPTSTHANSVALGQKPVLDIPPPLPTTVRNETPRVGRNDPCPCGSGKKFKKCCGAN
ncbi:MAG: DUF1186 domain-containing protein [Planctomycetota bacterium]|nr:DUF1186 domain-containing protein [Planctomycetota bacterium]